MPTMSLWHTIKCSKLKEIECHSTTNFSITYILPDGRQYSISTYSNSSCYSFVQDLKRAKRFIYEFRSIADNSYERPFMKEIYNRVMNDIKEFKQTQNYKNALKENARPSIIECLRFGVDPNALKDLIDEVFGQISKETK